MARAKKTTESLTEEENYALAELIELAQGIGNSKDLASLDDDQKRIIYFLQAKGYVTIENRQFTVVQARK